MPKKIAVRAEEIHDCPVYQLGDAMTFSLPELVMPEGGATCAIAVSDLLPWAIKLTAGGEPTDQPLLCRGCRGGRSQASFSLEVHVEAERSERATQKLVSLRSIPLFSPLPDRQLDKIEPMIHEVRYEEGDEIVTFGQPGQALSIVTKGTVAVLRPDDDGTEKLLAILSPGECFGEMSLLTGDPCNATIRARDGAVKTMQVTKEDFDALLGRNPVLNRYFSKLLALRLNKMSKQFTDLETGAVTGELHMIGPTELIQAITVTDRTGTLRIQSGPQAIDLLFHEGQIWDMDAGDADPEETFFDFLAWSRGRFSFEPAEDAPDPSTRRFFKDTTSLLLEGMRRMDEEASDVGAAEAR